MSAVIGMGSLTLTSIVFLVGLSILQLQSGSSTVERDKVVSKKDSTGHSAQIRVKAQSAPALPRRAQAPRVATGSAAKKFVQHVRPKPLNSVGAQKLNRVVLVTKPGAEDPRGSTHATSIPPPVQGGPPAQTTRVIRTTSHASTTSIPSSTSSSTTAAATTTSSSTTATTTSPTTTSSSTSTATSTTTTPSSSTTATSTATTLTTTAVDLTCNCAIPHYAACTAPCYCFDGLASYQCKPCCAAPYGCVNSVNCPPAARPCCN